MIKLHTFALSIVIAVSSTAVVAESNTQSVVRLVILGKNVGNGIFEAKAVSISAGASPNVAGSYVAGDGVIGTAVAVGADGTVSENLNGFNTDSSTNNLYETVVCKPGTCPE